MIFENMIKLGVPCLDTVVKVGDTIADIKEGVNAKVWMWASFSAVMKWDLLRRKQIT